MKFRPSHTSALRPLNWRWLEAAAAVRTKPKAKKKRSANDQIIEHIRQYLLKKDVERVSCTKLARLFPEIYEADYIFEDRDTLLRWTLEALVVANEPQEAIADYLGEPVAVVQAYEDCFFDVRSRLKARGFVRSVLISDASLHPSKEDPDKYWKILAMAGGAAQLYSYWEFGVLTKEQIELNRDLVCSRMVHNAVDAAFGIQHTRENVPAILTIHNDDRKHELAVEQAKGGNQAAEAEQTKALIANLGLTVVDMRTLAGEPPPRLVEPRVDDLLKQQLARVSIEEEVPEEPA